MLTVRTCIQGVSKKRCDRFLSFSQPLKHPKNKLRAISNRPFCGLLENVQKLNNWVKIGRDIYKIVKTRKNWNAQICWILRSNNFSFPTPLLNKLNLNCFIGKFFNVNLWALFINKITFQYIETEKEMHFVWKENGKRKIITS